MPQHPKRPKVYRLTEHYFAIREEDKQPYKHSVKITLTFLSGEEPRINRVASVEKQTHIFDRPGREKGTWGPAEIRWSTWGSSNIAEVQEYAEALVALAKLATKLDRQFEGKKIAWPTQK